MRKKHNNGFTLAEILVVVIIVSVTASMALPRFTGHLEKTRAAEGIQMLDALLKAQRAFYYENNAFTNNLANLDIDVGALSHFSTPTLSTTDPIASIQRSTSAYTLRINSNGTISCVPSGGTCGHLGF